MSGGLLGGCACGAVRYRLASKPLFIHCCHCRDCQRQTGGAFVLNGLIETDRIALLSGAPEPVPVPVPTDSGSPHVIYRCPHCHVALWSDYGGRPWLRFVRLMTLDDPGWVVPDVHIYTRSKLAWVTLPPGALTFEAIYDPQEVWPEAAKARRRAAVSALQASR
jgi:hypothetical protein